MGTVIEINISQQNFHSTLSRWYSNGLRMPEERCAEVTIVVNNIEPTRMLKLWHAIQWFSRQFRNLTSWCWIKC